MIFRPLRIRPDIMIEHDPDSRQARRLHARGAVERGQDEEVQRDDGGGRVSREGEDEAGLAGAGGRFEGDGGEGGGFAGFHGHAAEVDGAAEGALDGRFEEVEFAHGDAACGDDDGHAAEGGAERGFEIAGPGGE